MPFEAPAARVRERLARLVELRPQEFIVLAWAWLYVLALMAAYYVIRPIRDTMGVEGGVENLQWLFTGTLLAMLAINPPYAALVRRLPRVRFITWTYLFFATNLIGFIFLLQAADEMQRIWIGRGFFIWVSVFNLFVVSVFWALMVDVFRAEQARRLFGLISAGATVGAICGSARASGLASRLEAHWLLSASALLLLLAVLAVRRLSQLAPHLREPGSDAAAAAEREAEAPVGGSILSGLTHMLRSPYLLGIGAYILLFTVTSTFLYFQQASIVRDHFPDRASRTAFFANVDLVVNILTLLLQVFLTSRFIKCFGVAIAAAVLPALSLAGFGLLALAPTVAAIVAVQVLRRVANFGLAKPTREMLFTVLPREDKYKAKSVLDTVVYRSGDQLGSWSYALLGSLGAGVAGVALTAVPLAALWVGNALWLGRRQKQLAAEAAQR
ncbi:MAG: MFS transporter [Candidatus Dactylopiibacterium carminicum]|uniref:MFS transporter n=1 Tax=Candidatus Dactylopiibacterium carminicum TaxID=857335 RepID=A0A272EP61_9RHOO|nr:Npt1/Npt2 family nucleotide transporter [Candidatus Dactylopiibacterium carminicum]KAF7598245.1 MFS transporter [Candidatus Dactylopiibacterium carminicum]PAS91899.1 MAG: MFS transporter [Candidatus Dactylopiibacterium carminicum]PAS94875.1 MAG: MFS transporter [Candidatus Dactylopiibacterium carminicum]PAS97088.1 MAG: MFS transporter [Candidatus Dactylopiibacterium carminicum]